MWEIGEYFETDPPKKYIHIAIKTPGTDYTLFHFKLNLIVLPSKAERQLHTYALSTFAYLYKKLL